MERMIRSLDIKTGSCGDASSETAGQHTLGEELVDGLQGDDRERAGGGWRGENGLRIRGGFYRHSRRGRGIWGRGGGKMVKFFKRAEGG